MATQSINREMLSKAANFVENHSGKLAIGGTAVAIVAYLALKALGFGSIVTGCVLAVPVAITAFAACFIGKELFNAFLALNIVKQMAFRPTSV
jgi:uracil phosphoribosyltransferase